MANDYSEGTGVLVLEKVTPVINALFGPLRLDVSYPGHGEAYIALSSEKGDPSWDQILENLRSLAIVLPLKTPPSPQDTLSALLHTLAVHFGVENEAAFSEIAENDRFVGSVDPDTLFRIAIWLDDGHGLQAIKLQSAQHYSTLCLFEFGGAGFFISKEVALSSTSSDALSLGDDLQKALRSADLDAGAARIVLEVETLLASVSNTTQRKGLHWRVADLLAASFQDSTRSS